MDCIPPWLSSNNQCDTNITTYNHTKLDIATIISDNFSHPKFKAKPSKAEKKCKNPCKQMKNTLSVISDLSGRVMTELEFNFKKTVRVEKKVIVYTWFNFIIDVGSSLGLWLGLSALNITDLVIEAFMVAKKWLKVK